MEIEEFKYTLTNLWRSRRLIDLAKKTTDSEETKNDLLGSAVVFLHATLEEFLRGVALREWQKLNDTDLKKVIKRHSRLGNKNVKISLVELAEMRKKPIESILDKEIKDFLYQDMNFNSIGEIEKFLEDINFSLEKVKEVGEEHFGNIQSLIRKRHLIAHQANCSDLDLDQVMVWGKSLQTFLFYLTKELGLDFKYAEDLDLISFKVIKDS